MKKSIYPKIEVRETPTSLTLSTTLRKEHNGKWYLWEFFKKWDYKEDNEKAKRQAIGMFHQEVYFTIVCGRISEDLINMEGYPIFKEDKNQISEIDRIKQFLYI